MSKEFSKKDDTRIELFPDEELVFSHLEELNASEVVDEDIDEKYVKGDVRIVTEQARYPLNSIPKMLESGDYILQRFSDE